MCVCTRILVEVVPATDSTVGKYSQITMQTHSEGVHRTYSPGLKYVLTGNTLFCF